MINTQDGVQIKVSRVDYDPQRIQVEYFGPGSMYRRVFLTRSEADRINGELMAVTNEVYADEESS